MNIVQNAKSRYSTKAFDSSIKLSDEQILAIKELLRLSPSSVNSQPWHFIIASSSSAKERIARATQGDYVFNEQKILNASHVLVLCTKESIDEVYLNLLLENEERDGRFANEEIKQGQRNGRNHFVNLHQTQLKDTYHWMEKQVYLNLGSLLLGASTLGIDAVPIEGFDSKILDYEFALKNKGFKSSVIVSLGARSQKDFNALLPKSRHAESYLFSEV
ncbi:oxygen-insensitive NAD(P)H nitroreductase [Vibrio lentus]|uniref:NAD(P)H nitroreductase n=1 Tax=Vibrio lentus TaxID=136468 RepID=A0AA44VSS8_9VIBR|nr:oxygen-insensitive NAD(P)H nitroreductase [Vibrio lentus]MCB5358332.1 oxygen-insensitive NAD(P)H nitroreductase [Vibrio lentus]MCB5448801.1 oxygen-insensitive NAD(P)H nitroreductase [Vibrio lentus]MCB5460688.1 oxygen-insensitive NAD(P)H nitroreductase [Vibrio lentus]MCC4795546.1 oxygen-insensitive NAD(P)H nitroreductase [Vibrio lentus]MCC4852422.1 oxygen-insensitive NAD(P)H nitroreductase [Vibrio lentus]